MERLISNNIWLSAIAVLGAVTIGCSGSSDGVTSRAMLDVDASLDVENPIDAELAADSGPDMLIESRLPTVTAAPANSQVVLEPKPLTWDILPDGNLVFSDGTQIWLKTDDETVLLGTSDEPLLAATVVDGEILVLAPSGVYSSYDGELERSPLNDELAHIKEIKSDLKGGVWLLDQSGISHWKSGRLRRRMLSDVDLSFQHTRAAIGRYQDEDVIWLTDGQLLLAIGETQAWRFQWQADLDWVTTSQAGLWVASGAELQLMLPDGTISVWTKPEDASTGLGSPQSDNLWLSSGFVLHQWDGNSLRERSNSPDHSALRIDSNGALYLGTANGIEKVLGRRFVIIDGLSDGDRITLATQVNIEPSESASVEFVSARLNETTAVEVDSIEGWSLNLDPNDVGPGEHLLSIEITYTDGVKLEDTVSFLGPPSWASDIKPISETYCIACHGDGGSAHRMVSRDAWMAEITWIVDDIETGRMPYGLPRLSDELVDLVIGWQESGFLE